MHLINHNFHQRTIFVNSLHCFEKLWTFVQFLRSTKNNYAFTTLLVILQSLEKFSMFKGLCSSSQAKGPDSNTSCLQLLVENERNQWKNTEINSFLNKRHDLKS